ncbi:MAG TPA: hypothetical protein VNO14_03710, partial [Blastocatellia bacterium]|nr:hypothetical protein [Blastocatellia bacterium]
TELAGREDSEAGVKIICCYRDVAPTELAGAELLLPFLIVHLSFTRCAGFSWRRAINSYEKKLAHRVTDH